MGATVNEKKKKPTVLKIHFLYVGVMLSGNALGVILFLAQYRVLDYYKIAIRFNN